MTFRLGSTRSAMTFMLLLSFVSLTLLHATPALSRALCGPMDMAIVLDNTSSMGGAIDNVKAALPTIISDAKNASDGDLRLGYITFRDTVTILDPLTTDIAAVQASIEDEFASGGDGYPEASDEAMNTAVNNMAERPGQTGDFTEPWRDEAVKILILITDAEPGGFDDTFDAGVDDEAMHTHAETARRKGILISSIFVPTGEDYADRIHPSPILEDQARTTGGGYIETSIDGVGTADAIDAIIAGCGRFPERFLKPEPIAAVAGLSLAGASAVAASKVGERFRGKGVDRPEPGAVRFCQNCGGPVMPGANFCGSCGFKTHSAEQLRSSTVSGGVLGRLGGLLPEPLVDAVKYFFEEALETKGKVEVKRVDAPLFLTGKELVSLAFAAGTLALAFAYGLAPALDDVLLLFPLTLGTVATVELAKELAQEFTARKTGNWSEYRAWPLGLVALTISTGLFKAPFSVPGKSWLHRRSPSKRSEGLVAASSSIALYLVAGVFFFLLISGARTLGSMGLSISLAMALYELIPTPPLNGKDVFDWSKPMWALLFSFSALLYALHLLALA